VYCMVKLSTAIIDNLTFVLCFVESHSVAELGGEADRDGRGSLAHESCQTALSMSEMRVVSSLAQVMHCECHAHAPQLRGGGSPQEYTCANERTTPNSATWASNSPAKNQLYAHIPGVTKLVPRPGSQPSPPRPKAKWNSDVRCNWPPSSPPRGAAPARRPAHAPDSKTRDVGVMTFPAISAGDLIKKVEALELELDIHVGNERQLLSVNEQLRKRCVNRELLVFISLSEFRIYCSFFWLCSALLSI
jgi:hypothetical protein